jgi:hypothetical protein
MFCVVRRKKINCHSFQQFWFCFMQMKCHVMPNFLSNGLMLSFSVLSCLLLIFFVIFHFPWNIDSLLVGIYVMDKQQCWHICCAVCDIFALFLCQHLKRHAEEILVRNRIYLFIYFIFRQIFTDMEVVIVLHRSTEV